MTHEEAGSVEHDHLITPFSSKQLTWGKHHIAQRLVDSNYLSWEGVQRPVAHWALFSDQQCPSLWGHMLEGQNSSFSSDLLNESLHLNKILILTRFAGVYKFERHCSVTVVLDPDYKLK